MDQVRWKPVLNAFASEFVGRDRRLTDGNQPNHEPHFFCRAHVKLCPRRSHFDTFESD